jgi:hypothetical protein
MVSLLVLDSFSLTLGRPRAVLEEDVERAARADSRDEAYGMLGTPFAMRASEVTACHQRSVMSSPRFEGRGDCVVNRVLLRTRRSTTPLLL